MRNWYHGGQYEKILHKVNLIIKEHQWKSKISITGNQLQDIINLTTKLYIIVLLLDSEVSKQAPLIVLIHMRIADKMQSTTN